MLRVLHVVEAFGGGLFEVVRTVAERHAASGDVVGIAYGRRPETPAAPEREIGQAVELFETPWTARTPRAQAETVAYLRRLVDDWRPDLVHLHSSFAGVIGVLAVPRRTPVIYTPHGYSFTMRDQSDARRAAYRVAEAAVARRSDVVGAVSLDEARRAREVLHAPRVAIVRNGVPELDPGGLPPPAAPRVPRVIAMGRLDEARQPEAAARILERLTDLADVAWVGGGGRTGGLERHLAAVGVPVTGWLDRRDALRELSRSTAYLHWAAWDGQPLTVLEAMARDVVVVATDIEPLRELLDPRQRCRDEDEAVHVLRSALTDQVYRSALIEAQRRERVGYGAERMCCEWRNLYASLVRGAHVAGREEVRA